jgi:hypothetical protein
VDPTGDAPFQGRTIGKETDTPFAGKTGGLMGIAVAPNEDVWIADGSKNQLLIFRGGRLQDGRIVHVAGLASPFGGMIRPDGTQPVPEGFTGDGNMNAGGA